MNLKRLEGSVTQWQGRCTDKARVGFLDGQMPGTRERPIVRLRKNKEEAVNKVKGDARGSGILRQRWAEKKGEDKKKKAYWPHRGSTEGRALETNVGLAQKGKSALGRSRTENHKKRNTRKNVGPYGEPEKIISGMCNRRGGGEEVAVSFPAKNRSRMLTDGR